ncbi:MAG: hypothetical protein LBE02_04640 [Spirochaetaceae bacterium]|jgi:hypothetical protein|nr:hypothetical protein [Spirochaetaceae bacterium]
MGFGKWKSSSVKTKVSGVLMATAAILTLVIGFWILDAEGLPVPSFFQEIGGMIVLATFVIDAIVAIGLFAVARWARRLTIYWGIFEIIFIVSSFGSGFSIWFIPEVLTAVAAILLLFAGKDFRKEG